MFKAIREMLKDSRYLATMKEQNDLLRATLEKEREQKAETDLEKYQKRKQNYLRPVNEMKEFVRSHYEVRHNVVTDVYEYRRREDGLEAPFVMIDKRQFNTIANEVEGADIFCLDSFVRRNLECDFAYDYHPVTDYLNKVRGRWDGVDRVTELLSRISEEDYCLRMGRVWLRAVVAQWLHYDQDHANAVMLLLVSEVEQGEQFYFTKDMEQEMQKRNQQYYRLEPVEELISTFFRKARDGEEPREVGSAQMMKQLDRHNHKLMCQMSQSVFGKHMRRLGFSARHTEQGNVYEVVER